MEDNARSAVEVADGSSPPPAIASQSPSSTPTGASQLASFRSALAATLGRRALPPTAIARHLWELVGIGDKGSEGRGRARMDGRGSQEDGDSPTLLAEEEEAKGADLGPSSPMSSVCHVWVGG